MALSQYVPLNDQITQDNKDGLYAFVCVCVGGCVLVCKQGWSCIKKGILTTAFFPKCIWDCVLLQCIGKVTLSKYILKTS